MNFSLPVLLAGARAEALQLVDLAQHTIVDSEVEYLRAQWAELPILELEELRSSSGCSRCGEDTGNEQQTNEQSLQC